MDGKVEFKEVCVKYRDNLPLALKKVSFKLLPGEKLGIVGRSGSGKSTIALCLPRLLELYTGEIKIDGINLESVPLAKIRERITFICQDQTILSGSLRFNLDPLGKHLDQEL